MGKFDQRMEIKPQPSCFDGIIFDFNGVLFWDDAVQRDSWRSFSALFRNEPLSNGEIDDHVHGRNGKHTLEYILGHPINPKKAEELIDQKETLYRQMCLGMGDSFTLSPGAANLLENLVYHSIPLTIATASDKKNVDFFIRHLGLDHWFDINAIVFDDGKIPGKPAPDLILKAASNLNLPPESCVVIEDSRSGIQAAINAGIGHVIALGPLTKHSELHQIEGVDQVIESLLEVQLYNLFL